MRPWRESAVWPSGSIVRLSCVQIQPAALEHLIGWMLGVPNNLSQSVGALSNTENLPRSLFFFFEWTMGLDTLSIVQAVSCISGL